MALDRRSIDREYKAMILLAGVRPRACTLIFVPNSNAVDKRFANCSHRPRLFSIILQPSLPPTQCYLGVDQNPNLAALLFRSLFGSNWTSGVSVNPHVMILLLSAHMVVGIETHSALVITRLRSSAVN
jgi:hypothetical protein